MICGENYMDTRGIFKIVFRSNNDMERDRIASRVRLHFETNEGNNTGENIEKNLRDTERQCKN